MSASFLLDVLNIVAFSLGVLFPLWPFIVLAPLGWRRGNVRVGMLIMWFAMFAGWLLVKAMDVKTWVLLIPESASTALFFITGVVLVAWSLAVGLLPKRSARRKASTARRPQDLLDISPVQFENMVVDLYRMKGYEAVRTGATGDHGVDVVVKTSAGEKWVVQCKRWRGWVGEPEVRDFYGTMQHEKAARGILVTTGTFSMAARNWAKGKPLALVDGSEFLRTWKTTLKRKS